MSKRNMPPFVVVICQSIIYKVDMSPFETLENAYERDWFIATKCDASLSQREKIALSHMYTNEKRLGMKYVAE